MSPEGRLFRLSRDYTRCVSAELAIDLRDLPGADLIQTGLDDLAAGRDTVPAALAAIGSARLGRSGIAIRHQLSDPEDHLYRLLEREGEDSAHSRYDALIRQLVSFERAVASGNR